MRALPTRTIVLWCPDWPVLQTAKTHRIAGDAPVALIDRGAVFACSAAARREGVRRGLRIREAQGRCPDLLALPYDPALVSRAFEFVLDEIESLIPGVQAIRPGTCALRARGPSRYYGGEKEAGIALIRHLEACGVPDVRIGVADGLFAAEQAARGAHAACRDDRVSIVPPGASGEFLAPLPIETIGLPDLAPLLRRLGVPTLGALAALEVTDVRDRFGEPGERAHRWAAGLDGRPVVPRAARKELDRWLDLEPPLDRVDQVAFAFRATAEAFIAGLAEEGLVTTAIRIEVTSESGETGARSWSHPLVFDTGDLIDRVRWQLQGSGEIDAGLSSAISRVLVSPETVDDIAHHEKGLWGDGVDERVHHGLSRVQSMLGHTAVLTPTIGGGRGPADRQILVPWGDEAPRPPEDAAPWPGSLPPPWPTSVFRTPRPAMVLQPTGEPVGIDSRGAVTGPIGRFSPTGDASTLRPATGWAGPWPVRERWWDGRRRRSVSRFQVVDEGGEAWLLLLDDGTWWTEAKYD